MIKSEKSKQLLNPPGWPLFVAGLVAGLVSGLLALLSSADIATAVGLAWFIGVALGGWLGLATARLLSAGFLTIYKRQIERVNATVDGVVSRLTLLLDAKGIVIPSHNGHSLRANDTPSPFFKARRSLWSFSWRFYPLGIIGTFSYGLVITLSYVGGIDISLHLILLALAAAVTFPALMFAWVFPLALTWRIIHISRRLLRKIDRIEQQSAEARVEDITLSIPDLASIEKTIDTPSKLLTRLAA